MTRRTTPHALRQMTSPWIDFLANFGLSKGVIARNFYTVFLFTVLVSVLSHESLGTTRELTRRHGARNIT